MLKTVFFMIFVFFFVLGILAAAVLILLKASAPSRKNRFLILTFSDGNDRECLLKLRWLTVFSALLGLESNIDIGVIDMGMTEESKNEILSVFSNKKQVIIIKKTETDEKKCR